MGETLLKVYRPGTFYHFLHFGVEHSESQMPRNCRMHGRGQGRQGNAGRVRRPRDNQHTQYLCVTRQIARRGGISRVDGVNYENTHQNPPPPTPLEDVLDELQNLNLQANQT